MASNHNVLEAAVSAASNAPSCPSRPTMRAKYHDPSVCLSKPTRPNEGHVDRKMVYRKLLAGGAGASLVPNTETVVCPIGDTVDTLEADISIKGFDTTWIVENTSSKHVVLAWVVGGIEYSPFEPDLKPMDDPKALLKPGDWTSVPTFESFVYHVREIDEEGGLGNVVLQHRAGMIPLGGNAPKRELEHIDPEPFSLESVGTEDNPKPQVQEVGRKPTRIRPCNVVDLGFRNEAGFPLSVYWANNLVDVPETGFSCAEQYKFHMGLKTAPQDFMWDWGSKTKYEGSFVGHTFVARRADDPSVVVDKYTLEPTRIIDCPSRKKKQVVAVPTNNDASVEVQDSECIPNDASEDSTTPNETERGSLPDVVEGLTSRSAASIGFSGSSG